MGNARGPKIVSHPARKLRQALVENLKRTIAREYPGISETAAFERIEEDTGISLSSMQRITSGKTGPSIDTLADLAHHLGTTVPELLSMGKLTADEDSPFPSPRNKLANQAKTA